MKKPLIIFSAIFIFLVFIIVGSIILGFTIVKPTVEQINQNIAQNLSKLVRIPKGIPPAFGFDKTEYLWEMETIEKEVTAVKLTHLTGIPKNQDKITIILELPENGDPSIFNKVLPAVIADGQSLNSALDPQKANFSPNESVGYESLNLALRQSTGQTVKITWSFEKGKLGPELPNLYSKLSIYPEPILRFLYEIPNFTIGLLSGA